MTYRLPPNLQKRMDAANEMVKRRLRELAAEAKQPSAEEAERRAQAAEYMKDYHRRMKDKRDAEAAQRDAVREQELAPIKRREMLAWIVDHPDQGESDFERIWPAKRELLQLDDRNAAIRREVEAQRGRAY